MKSKPEVVDAIIREAEMRSGFTGGEAVETIYFGGGTPSVLDILEVEKILQAMNRHFKIRPTAEITFEANPDHLTSEYTVQLRKAGINRLSIGIQSWFDDDLRNLNRRHNAFQGEASVKAARDAGIDNISIDLIYGLPGMDSSRWKYNLEQSFRMDIQHLSAYHLTYEPGTRMYHQLRKARIRAVTEEESIGQYYMLLDMAESHGFRQYELSNFCHPGYESRHNSTYWNSGKYLGLGPSAHSFDGERRTWNIANNRKYIEGIRNGTPETGEELPGMKERYNEYVMTSLRTVKGVNLADLRQRFGTEWEEYFLGAGDRYVLQGQAVSKDGYYRLTREGMMISDAIISELMMEV